MSSVQLVGLVHVTKVMDDVIIEVPLLTHLYCISDGAIVIVVSTPEQLV